MYAIVRKEIFSERVKLVEVEAPLVANKARPGQFVMVRVDRQGERIPMTVADCDPVRGTISLVFQEVGKTTCQMGTLEVGQRFENVVGPLGRPSEIAQYGTVLVVGGGVGIAPLFPITRALKQAGNRVMAVIGARSESMLFWQERMAEFSDRLIACTDDGSYGRQGLVTGPMREILEQERVDKAWVIGPAVMMKFGAQTTRPFGVATVASLNTVMIDGTGMCGGCRVVLEGGAQFVCVDGPEFDAHKVDWDNLLARLAFYRAEEKQALERWEAHQCRLNAVVEAVDPQEIGA